MRTFGLGLTVFAGIIAVVALSSIYGGYVFFWLWQWFAVPMGLRPISIPMAMGIAMLIRTPVISSKSDREFGELLFDAFVLNTLILVIGYIIHLFV